MIKKEMKKIIIAYHVIVIFLLRLKRIIIPDSVKSIGDDTFEGCSSLSSVKFCAYVENVGKNVFQFCSSLKSIIIPKGTMSKFEELLPEYIDKLVEQ